MIDHRLRRGQRLLGWLLFGAVSAGLAAAPQHRGHPARVPFSLPLVSGASNNLPPVPTFDAELPAIWTPQDALSRALDANPEVQVALATAQRQDALKLHAVSRLFPRISVTGTAEQRDPALIDRDLRVPPAARSEVAEHSYTARFEVRQLLFDGLASWHQVRRMSLLRKKASLDAREMFLRVAAQVRQAYDAILLRHRVVDVRRESVESLSRLAEMASRRFELGEIAEFESLRASSALQSAQADLAQAEADLARTEEVFCRLLYIPRPPDGVNLAGDLERVDLRLPFDEAISRAYAERLDLRGAELQLEAAKMAQRIAAGEALPRIEGYVGYDYRSSYYDFDRQLDGWVVGIVGRWDIFDGGQTVASSRAQRADRRIAEIRLEEARQAIGSQVRELYSGLEQAQTVMNAHAAARDLGQRSLQEAERLFEVGRAATEDVLNAQVAYREALIGWLGAVFTYNTTVYQIDYAVVNDAFLNGLAPEVE